MGNRSRVKKSCPWHMSAWSCIPTDNLVTVYDPVVTQNFEKIECGREQHSCGCDSENNHNNFRRCCYLADLHSRHNRTADPTEMMLTHAIMRLLHAVVSLSHKVRSSTLSSTKWVPKDRHLYTDGELNTRQAFKMRVG